MTLPVSKTKIWSASRMVDSRCATTMHMRSLATLSSVCCTMSSEAESKADVASSSRRTSGFFMSARAMATRCFCPPDSDAPRSPTCVS
mmetsp:Transcript_15994/g.49977  ORF Transcript_15994/g.49977 Transcript_15994/m.49977 type:complete len:88 (-) Transcript_15994:1166-1429(-)